MGVSKHGAHVMDRSERACTWHEVGMHEVRAVSISRNVLHTCVQRHLHSELCSSALAPGHQHNGLVKQRSQR